MKQNIPVAPLLFAKEWKPAVCFLDSRKTRLYYIYVNKKIYYSYDYILSGHQDAAFTVFL
jgi:hypothetical protein